MEQLNTLTQVSVSVQTDLQGSLTDGSCLAKRLSNEVVVPCLAKRLSNLQEENKELSIKSLDADEFIDLDDGQLEESTDKISPDEEWRNSPLFKKYFSPSVSIHDSLHPVNQLINEFMIAQELQSPRGKRVLVYIPSLDYLSSDIYDTYEKRFMGKLEGMVIVRVSLPSITYGFIYFHFKERIHTTRSMFDNDLIKYSKCMKGTISRRFIDFVPYDYITFTDYGNCDYRALIYTAAYPQDRVPYMSRVHDSVSVLNTLRRHRSLNVAYQLYRLIGRLNNDN